MLPFDYHSPTHFAFGPEKEKDAGACAQAQGATRILIHYGQNSVLQSGLSDPVKTSLEAAGLTVFDLGGAVPNPRDQLVCQLPVT